MLISYKEIDHPIYIFHDYISSIFKRIFELDLSEYDEDKLVHPDFKTILNSARVTILEPLKRIIKLYHNLPYGDKITLQVALSNNNTIAIFNDLNIKLIKYDELHPSISKELKIFFENLWNEYPQVVAMEREWGTVKAHYDLLVAEDNFDVLICPFCGIDTFEPSGDKYREAYDHIIAKAKYPFASINFKLLFPCCHKCNSNEKRDVDTLYDSLGNRRIAYYPYDADINLDNLSISIILEEAYNHHNLETLLRSISWKFEILRNGSNDDKLISWDLIYGIKRRFTKRICRLEKQWYGELIRLFKNSRQSGTKFEDFRDSVMLNLKYQIPIVGMGIIKYTYFRFMFSIVDIEEKLEASVTA